MSTKQITAAVQAEADICNLLDPPKAGVPAGAGIHIFIPVDFIARVALGQSVPGCTYASLEPDGTLYVSDTAQAQLAIPAAVQALTPQQQTQAAVLQTALLTAIVVTAQTAQVGT